MRKKLKESTAVRMVIENINSGFFKIGPHKITCPQMEGKCRECNFAINIDSNGCDCSWFPVKDRITPKLLKEYHPEYFI